MDLEWDDGSEVGTFDIGVAVTLWAEGVIGDGGGGYEDEDTTREARETDAAGFDGLGGSQDIETDSGVAWGDVGELADLDLFG